MHPCAPTLTKHSSLSKNNTCLTSTFLFLLFYFVNISCLYEIKFVIIVHPSSLPDANI